MKMKSLWIACLLALNLPVWAGESVPRATLPVIPAPMEYRVDSGYFYFTPSTTIGVESESQLRLVSNFVALLGHTVGFLPGIEIGVPEPDVRFTTVATMVPESYRLTVTTERVSVEASGDAGFFYALQTLRQLLPPVIEGKKPVARALCRIPAMTVNDVPRFGYRGLMIDVSRYFVPKDDLLKIVEVASMSKINKLHLHLVDDNGWRIEIKKYPRLTQVGAWRVKRDEPFPNRRNQVRGDEASKVNWARCPKWQARMKAEHIEHIEELQSYFMTRMSDYVRSKGKEVMGWDELTNSTLPEGAIIYGWQGLGKAALKAAEQGHRFVMTPARILYLSRYQGPQWFEPLTYFGNNTLKDVYLYEPVQSDWKPAYESLLMGVQASMWTEFCNSASDVEYQLFPRLLALADVAWAQKGTKDWTQFLIRLDSVLPHLEALGITCARSMYNIDHKVTPEKNKLRVNLSCIRPDVKIRYTIDGSEPTAASPLYEKPFTVDAATCIKAATFAQEAKMGQMLTLDLGWNLATGKRVIATNENSYVLTNGVRGSLRHTDFEWVGWHDQDASFVLDLGKKTRVSEVTLGCITNSGMAVHNFM